MEVAQVAVVRPLSATFSSLEVVQEKFGVDASLTLKSVLTN